jgi:Protein of unknown function (DUF4231)
MMSNDKLTEYVHGRYADMLAYYDKRAVQNKWAYRLFSWYIIVISGFLAPLMAIKEFKESIVPAFLTASVAVVAAILGHSKFHENWLRYRATWDCLKREPVLHAAGIGPYQNSADPNAVFVAQVESLITGEGKEWLAHHAAADDAKSKGPTQGGQPT